MKPYFTYKVINTFDTASLFLVLAVSVFLFSCKSNNPEEIKALTEKQDEPSISIENLETTILDSGRVKYRLITPILIKYSNAEEPFDDFPKGLLFLSYNKTGQVESQIKCNNARHNTKKKLWELNNNVEAINAKGEILNTEQLFWDMGKKIIYTDKHVKITTKTNISNGIGFESKEDMSNYTIKKYTGTFEIED